MTKAILISILTLIGSQAMADGFVCRSTEESLALAVFNQTTTPATRSAEIMVISDPQIGFGHQTIARFTKDTGTLTNRGAHYVGTVNPLVPDSSRKGENIAGTKMGQLKEVQLHVDFTYSRPVPEGEELEGTLTLVKLNGELIELEMECLRYLKGE
ncbi:MAG: hypothetical protein AB7N80_05385 [Bdellovibrionales bacterium]